MNGIIKQVPSIATDWLYKDENGTRIFSKEIYRPIGSDPWLECTDAEKAAWEDAHPTESVE